MQDWFFSQTNGQMIGIWLILEQLWALFLAAKVQAHLAPFSKGQMGNLSPLGFHYKNCAISRQAFHINFSASRCGRSHPGHLLFEKIQSHCFSRNQPNTVCLFSSGPARQFFALQRPDPPTQYFQRPRPPSLFCLAWQRSRLRFQFRRPLRRLHGLPPYP